MTQTNGDLPGTPEPATVSETPVDPSVGRDGATVPLVVSDAPAQPEGATDALAQSEKSSAGTVPPATMRSVRARMAGLTDVGQLREHNEDNFVIADLTTGAPIKDRALDHQVGARGTMFAVCDGMGGAAAGEVASQLAVDIVLEKMLADPAAVGRDELARRLVQAVEAAGLRIFTEAKLDRARRGMGTTATVAALLDDHLFVAQVGDSRAYVLRGSRLVQVSRDQSLVNQLIEAGQLTEEEAETFEHNNIILQALGTADTVQVDLTYVHLHRGDTLMLCSDGLSGVLRAEEMRQVLASNDDPADACRVLVENANAAGGPDNITVIVATFEGAALAEPDGVDDLRYRKYSLPEEPTSGTSDPERRIVTLKGLEQPKLGADVKSIPPSSQRLTDHGPSRSKVTHTMITGLRPADADAARDGEAPLDSARRSDDEPYLVPTTAVPAWLVIAIVSVAVALAIVLGYAMLPR